TPLGIEPTSSHAPGSTAANDSNGSPAPVTLATGSTRDDTIDFGYELLGIGGGAFVIGDVEPHGLGTVVNFWGAQWWKNNFMSGLVTPGVAALKGFLDHVELAPSGCGGTWTTRPGNSSKPPHSIGEFVVIVVTDTI